MKPSTRIAESAYERGELMEVLDELDARLAALESRDHHIEPSHDIDAVCDRDADDVVRPPGPLGKPDGYSGNGDAWYRHDYADSFDGAVEVRYESERQNPKRRECWLLVANSEHGRSEAYYSQRPEWPGREAMGWTEHHLVEIRDGDVMLSKETAARIGRWLEFARGEGAPVDPNDLRVLGVEVES